ncbi:hypothetical protein ANN_13721 [Periplaneta americana]|uniref:Reverse transcriptase domain-containing protein n=1 Tax=Periplaneta americana TaxID=6978 RepID=A0ABQ8SUV9_PERAM|nr:hypothetical protein ANN_13721 [Periplaneta americana]
MAVFLDIAQAFDIVWHSGLLHKLQVLTIDDGLIHIIHSFFSDRTFQVKMENELSAVQNIHSGVPQGSIIAPHLYSVYIHDMPRSANCKLGLYADDTVYYTSDFNINNAHIKLQTQLNALETKPKKPDCLRLFSENINYKNEVKYLGVILDKRLRYSENVEYARNKALARFIHLYPLIRSPYLNLPLKVRLYTSVIRPVMTYGCEVWNSAHPRIIRKLHAIQRSVCLKVTGADYTTPNAQLQEIRVQQGDAQYNERVDDIRLLEDRSKETDGTDPTTYELLQKNKLLQKRLLALSQTLSERECQLQESQKTRQKLEDLLSCQPGPDVALRLQEAQHALREKDKKIKNKVLRKIFGAKRDEVTGEWRKLHNTELHALYSSPDIIRNIKSRRLRWSGHVARMGESRNAYRVLVGRPEGKRPLGRPRRRWEDNIKMDLREVEYDGRDWINLAQGRDRWRAYCLTAELSMNEAMAKEYKSDLEKVNEELKLEKYQYFAQKGREQKLKERELSGLILPPINPRGGMNLT